MKQQGNTKKDRMRSRRFTIITKPKLFNEEPSSLKENPKKLGICILISTLVQRKQEMNEDFKKILQLTNENDSESVRILNQSLSTLRDENKLLCIKLAEMDEDIQNQKTVENEHHGGMKNKQLQIKKMEEDHNELKAQLKVEVEKVRSLKQQLDKIRSLNDTVNQEKLDLEMKLFNFENDQNEKALQNQYLKNEKDYDQEIDN